MWWRGGRNIEDPFEATLHDGHVVSPPPTIQVPWCLAMLPLMRSPRFLGIPADAISLVGLFVGIPADAMYVEARLRDELG